MPISARRGEASLADPGVVHRLRPRNPRSEDASVEIHDTHYAITADGVYIAYQVFGDGPIDVVWQSDWPGNIDVELEDPFNALWLSEVASFARVIFHDRRGIGLSSRNVALPNLETRVADTLAVMDAVGSERPILVGVFESGLPMRCWRPPSHERAHSMLWMEPNPRFAWAPDFPWGRTPEDMETRTSRHRAVGFTLAYGRGVPLGRGLAWQRDAGITERDLRQGEPERLHARRRACSREDLVRVRRPRDPARRAGADVDPVDEPKTRTSIAQVTWRR